MNNLYMQLAEIYSQRGKSHNGGKKIRNNLWVMNRQDSDSYSVRHHRTDIIKCDNNGNITLNNDGWYSVTTKKHLNTFLKPLGYYINQKDDVWYITDLISGQVVEYHNGVNLKNLRYESEAA